MDPLDSLLVVAVAKSILCLLTRKEVVMANLSNRLTKMSDASKAFVLETFATFGIVTIVRAVMVPPALSGL